MSATIREGKMSFSVSGFGFDDVRADSGEGAIEDFNRYAMGISTGCFDATGQYLWLGCYGGGHTAGLLKYDMDDDFTEVAHTVPTSQSACVVLHASTDNNNLGLCIQGANWHVFDLTDDTVIASGSDANIPTYIDWTRAPFDVALNGTKFLITTPKTVRTTPIVMSLDYSDGTFTTTTISGYQRAGNVFINSNILYLYYPAEWQYHNDVIEGVSPSGSGLWFGEATGTYDNVQMSGFGKAGRLYVPSFVYSAWRLGEYSGTRVPDFATPKPIKVIGKFTSKPKITRFEFSTQKKQVAFTSDIGIFVTDFEELEKITDDVKSVIAVNDKYVIVDAGYASPQMPSTIGIYTYR